MLHTSPCPINIGSREKKTPSVNSLFHPISHGELRRHRANKKLVRLEKWVRQGGVTREIEKLTAATCHISETTSARVFMKLKESATIAKAGTNWKGVLRLRE